MKKIYKYIIALIILATAILVIIYYPFSAQKLFEPLSPSRSGIHFANNLTESEENNILVYEYFYNGGGVAVGDINNDGLDDVYFTANMKSNALYLNRGDLKFEDITKSAKVGGKSDGWTTGVTMVDINHDNLLDIYVCYSGRGDRDMRRNQLFINMGNNQFEEKAAEFGLDDPSYSIHSAFFDYDLDGDLDMYLLNHNSEVIDEVDFDKVKHLRDSFAGDKLFENVDGKFIDVSPEAGIKGNPLGFGLGVAVSDINMDGWPDLYISNDYIEPDYMYINNKDGTFTDKMEHYLEHISHFSMGSDIADINNDGAPDIYTLDMLPEDNKRLKLLYGPEGYDYYRVMTERGFYHQNMRNMLHLNNANGTFSEIGQLAGISNTDWSWASTFGDFNNDGNKDLFVTNGYYRNYTDRDFLKYKNAYFFQQQTQQEKADTFHLVQRMTSTPTHNYIFENSGKLKFENKNREWGFEDKNFSNGASYADLDNDGDLEIIVNNLNDSARIFENRANVLYKKKTIQYLSIKLRGNGKNVNGIGSKVYVYSGGQMQFFEMRPSRGYQSSLSNKIHVGLGNEKQVDSLIVKWPKGNVSEFKNIRANQAIEISEENSIKHVQGSLNEHNTKKLFEPTFTRVQNRYIKNPFVDFERQPLLLTMLSNCGPVMTTEDLNNDGLQDLFIGGMYGNAGKIFIQHDSLGFYQLAALNNASERYFSDSDALFIDVDNDDDLDLYVASGGYHNYDAADTLLQDRIYIHDGNGSFKKDPALLPKMRTSSSCVVASDYDNDGDLDLFVGGRVIPGAYPKSPRSYLLNNQGKGRYEDYTGRHMPDIVNDFGMVTDAEWVDVNNDGWEDLVVVGEYTPVTIFINKKGKELVNSTDQYFETSYKGLWSKLSVADFDKDGDQDLLIGNFGLNTQLKASEERPIEVLYDDFDNNGSVDHILQYYIGDQQYPFASRDELLKQMNNLRKQFPDYSSYAKAQLSDILEETTQSKAQKLYANTLESAYFENKEGRFIKHALPVEIQFAPIYAIEVLDYNKDGHLDFIAAGNQSSIRLRLGKIDANFGQLFQGDGMGNFEYVPQSTSGLKIKGDVKSLRYLPANERKLLFVGINNVGIAAYELTW